MGMSEDPDVKGSPSELEKARQLLSSTAIRALAEDRWHKWRPWLDWPLLLVFVLAMSALFAPMGPSIHPVPPLDSIAPETVRAERDVLVEDRRATELRRQAIQEGALPLYDYDPEFYFAEGDKVSAAVQAMAQRTARDVLPVAARRAAFEADLGRPVDAGTFALIEELESATDLDIALSYFLYLGLDRMIVEERAALPPDKDLLVHDLSLNISRPVSAVDAIIDLKQMARLMRARAGNAPFGEARVVRTWVLRTAAAMARPNLVANESAAAERLETALRAVEPVYVRIDSGEVVIREGDRVTAAVQERIRTLNEGTEKRTLWGETLAFAALLSGLLVLGALFFRRARQPLRLGRKASFLALSITLSTALI